MPRRARTNRPGFRGCAQRASSPAARRPASSSIHPPTRTATHPAPGIGRCGCPSRRSAPVRCSAGTADCVLTTAPASHSGLVGPALQIVAGNTTRRRAPPASQTRSTPLGKRPARTGSARSRSQPAERHRMHGFSTRKIQPVGWVESQAAAAEQVKQAMKFITTT